MGLLLTSIIFSGLTFELPRGEPKGASDKERKIYTGCMCRILYGALLCSDGFTYAVFGTFFSISRSGKFRGRGEDENSMSESRVV